MGGITDQRLYGEAIEVLAGLARDRGVLTLAQAVHKLSGLPADCFGLRDRGTLRQGLAADITVFDYYRLAIRSTVRKPHMFPAGMHHVLVNGRFAVRDGQPTGVRADRVLLRPAQSPTARTHGPGRVDSPVPDRIITRRKPRASSHHRFAVQAFACPHSSGQCGPGRVAHKWHTTMRTATHRLAVLSYSQIEIESP